MLNSKCHVSQASLLGEVHRLVCSSQVDSSLRRTMTGIVLYCACIVVLYDHGLFPLHVL